MLSQVPQDICKLPKFCHHISKPKLSDWFKTTDKTSVTVMCIYFLKLFLNMFSDLMHTPLLHVWYLWNLWLDHLAGMLCTCVLHGKLLPTGVWFCESSCSCRAEPTGSLKQPKVHTEQQPSILSEWKDYPQGNWGSCSRARIVSGRLTRAVVFILNVLVWHSQTHTQSCPLIPIALLCFAPTRAACGLAVAVSLHPWEGERRRDC